MDKIYIFYQLLYEVTKQFDISETLLKIVNHRVKFDVDHKQSFEYIPGKGRKEMHLACCGECCPYSNLIIREV